MIQVRISFWPGDRNSNRGRIHSRRPFRHIYFSLAKRRRTIHPQCRFRYVQLPRHKVLGLVECVPVGDRFLKNCRGYPSCL